jgi:hypothetical protein
MPIFTGPYVWKVTIGGELYGQNTDNVFFYGSSSVGANALDIINAWEASILPTWQDAVSDDYHFLTIDVDAVQGATDFEHQGIGVDGLVLEPAEPRFIAYAFRFNRQLVGERNGYKRVAGIPDSYVDNGVLDGTGIAVSNALAAKFDDALVTAGHTYVPLIQRRQHLGAPVVPPEYYTFAVCSALGVTTQNTRK